VGVSFSIRASLADDRLEYSPSAAALRLAQHLGAALAPTPSQRAPTIVRSTTGFATASFAFATVEFARLSSCPRGQHGAFGNPSGWSIPPTPTGPPTGPLRNSTPIRELANQWVCSTRVATRC
jgi:hypothetical protein